LLPALALAASAAVLLGADFWHRKEFASWAEKELDKILTDSPWAKPVVLPLESFGLPLELAEEICRGCLACSLKTFSGDGGSVRVLTLVVRWQSALPVKQALARLRHGEEAATSAMAAELLARVEPAYLVSVSGLPRRLLPIDPEKQRLQAQLRLKGRPSIDAYGVRLSDERQGCRLTFLFPRGKDAGHEITLADGQVRFHLNLGAVSLQRDFKLADMVYGGKLEM